MSIKIPIKTPKVVTITTKATNDGDITLYFFKDNQFKKTQNPSQIHFLFYLTIFIKTFVIILSGYFLIFYLIPSQLYLVKINSKILVESF